MAEESTKNAFHVIVSGRVQGVGFRYNTRNEAQRRKLTGWVKNLSEGSVEVFCEGDSKDVKSFLHWLKKGPAGAYVRNVEITPIQYKGSYKSFIVAF